MAIEVHYNGMTPGGWHNYTALVDGYLVTLRTDVKSMVNARAYFKAYKRGYAEGRG